MAESDVSRSETLTAEVLKVEAPHTGEVAAENILEWKAGSREWLILACLTIVTLVVVGPQLIQYRTLVFCHNKTDTYNTGPRCNHPSSGVTSM